MKNISNSDKIPENKTAVALGVFDGIHRGHQAVISHALSYHEEGLSSAVFTFSTRTITTKGNGALDSIMSDELKLEMLDDLGVKYVYSPDFSVLKDMTAEAFVEEILYKKMNAAVAVCGENFRFGKGASASSHVLAEICLKFGIKTHIMPYAFFNGTPINSTEIRGLIKEGSVDIANYLLGYDFHFRLNIVKGNQIGRTINFPTINQQFPSMQVIPRFGVYASETLIGGALRKSVTNIGVKPTIGGEEFPLAETHIFDFSDDIYGSDATIYLKRFIRPERKFSSINELRLQLEKDILKAKEILYFDHTKGGYEYE